RMAELEHQVYDRLVENIGEHTRALLDAARGVGEVDVLATFAEVSREHHYVRPEITAEPITEIEGGRHPVVERALGWAAYIPNNVTLTRGGSRQEGAGEAPSLMLLTGPNMAGKTTFGRMTLLICLMAQAGCFVPAERAHIG